jgi:hypothetical protein
LHLHFSDLLNILYTKIGPFHFGIPQANKASSMVFLDQIDKNPQGIARM